MTLTLSRRWRSPWLAMSAYVSVGYTPQMTDICVCHRHVVNVGPTRWWHSDMSANFSAVGVVLVNIVPNTLSYMYVGISTGACLMHAGKTTHEE